MPRVFEKDKFTKEAASVPLHPKVRNAINNAFNGTIHEVHIVDGSSSMSGGKFTSAVNGVNEDLHASREAATQTGLGGTCSVYQFSTKLDMEKHGNFTRLDIFEFAGYKPKHIGGSTSLYATIIQVINAFIRFKKPDDKVLLKISTDGQEYPNSSPIACAKAIANAQKNHGFTITFMGTKEDVAFVTNNLNVDASNTVTHENNAKSMGETFSKMKSSSVNYRSAVKRGDDVTFGFYGKQTD